MEIAIGSDGSAPVRCGCVREPETFLAEGTNLPLSQHAGIHQLHSMISPST